MLAGIATEPYVEREKGRTLSFIYGILVVQGRQDEAEAAEELLLLVLGIHLRPSHGAAIFHRHGLLLLHEAEEDEEDTAPSPASWSRFLLNSSRLQLGQQDVTTLDSLPPSVVDFFPSSR
jgi:hypothetical protein